MLEVVQEQARDGDIAEVVVTGRFGDVREAVLSG